jgi:hypothetical protein
MDVEFHDAFIPHFQQQGLARFIVDDVGALFYLEGLEGLFAKCTQYMFSIIQHERTLSMASPVAPAELHSKKFYGAHQREASAPRRMTQDQLLNPSPDIGHVRDHIVGLGQDLLPYRERQPVPAQHHGSAKLLHDKAIGGGSPENIVRPSSKCR